jgi:signal transduction histidine kinase
MNEPLATAAIALLVAFIAVFVYSRMLGRRLSAPPSTSPEEPMEQPSEPGVSDQVPPDDILEQIAEGVVVLDDQLHPTFMNAAARTILGLQAMGVPERITSQEVVGLAQRALTSTTPIEEVVGLWYPSRLSIKTQVTRLGPDRLLVLLQDITDEELAQRVRREFVSHASHELKSPVAGLQTLAEALGQALVDDPPAAARFAERMATEAGRLGRLVSDLLDLSKLEDPMRIPEDPIEISEIAKRELEQLSPAARTKGMSIVDRVQDGIWVKGDDDQIGLMIRNLLENAVRYTPDGGTVALELTNRDSHALIKVQDTGMGIPRDAQGRVFERFYRVDRARARDRGGTGLGLAIVKHVAELHGGEVVVESELGEGSIFTVFLPLLRAPEEPARRATG